MAMTNTKRPKINIRNLKRDFTDPDLKSYGKSLPRVNAGVMRVGIAKRKAQNYIKSIPGSVKARLKQREARIQREYGRVGGSQPIRIKRKK